MKSLLIIVSLSLINLVGYSQSKSNRAEMLKQELNISSDQEQKLEEAFKEHRNKTKSLKQEMQKSKQEFNRSLEDILTPEQIEKFKEIKKKKRNK